MKLRYGYLISGCITGIIILFSFIWTLPDGRLHVVFCDVGQGDAAYIRFPDGRDMVIDGGPNDSVLGCLGRHMPFWDRRIDIVVLTHPQKDHMQGLISIIRRYSIGSILRSDVGNKTEGFALLQKAIKEKNIPVRFMSQGNRIVIGSASFSFLWPSTHLLANVLGATTGDLNDYSLVGVLKYSTFDVLFTGDADSRVESQYVGMKLGSGPLEVLKVPHHGSKTGMTKEFIEWTKPEVSIISVGKNIYGHPTAIALEMINSVSSRLFRTDQAGDVEIVSNGSTFVIKTQKKVQ